MPITRVKICGLTNATDALAAAQAGADAVGMVFHTGSKRGITLEQARDILSVLPPFVTPVGLFVDQPNDVILRTAAALGLRHVQLHGHELPRQIADLRPLAVIKAVRVVKGAFTEELHRWKTAIAIEQLDHLRGLVLETAATPEAGGSGVGNDWATASAAMQAGAFAGLPAIIAAGGLTDASVGAVIASLRPWAVDVSSGVEDAPGRKSVEKLQAFIRAVRQADDGLHRSI